MPLHVYEANRPPRRQARVQLQIPKDVRQEMLMREWDVSFTSIRKATLEVNKNRESRRKTVRQIARNKRTIEFLKRLLCLTTSRWQKDVSTLPPASNQAQSSCTCASSTFTEITNKGTDDASLLRESDKSISTVSTLGLNEDQDYDYVVSSPLQVVCGSDELSCSHRRIRFSITNAFQV